MLQKDRQPESSTQGCVNREGCSNLFHLQSVFHIQGQRRMSQHPIRQPLLIPPDPLQPIIVNPEALPSNSDNQIPKVYEEVEHGEKIIPGYNFESLFRKKSHIRLARKKNKEESQKRSLNPKIEMNEKQAKNIQKGHWCNQQSKLYHWFLQLHNKHFVYKYMRRTDKIFKSMANFIQTREAEQCRSHHQKMEKKYRSFYQILMKLRMDFFGSMGPEGVRGELEDQGYKLKDGAIISQTQLRNGQANLGLQGGEEGEESRRAEGHESQLSQEQSNILAQNYENGLHLRHINY